MPGLASDTSGTQSFPRVLWPSPGFLGRGCPPSPYPCDPLLPSHPCDLPLEVQASGGGGRMLVRGQRPQQGPLLQDACLTCSKVLVQVKGAGHAGGEGPEGG